MNSNKDLPKMRFRHPKDFAVQQTVLEMFIVSYAFTSKNGLNLVEKVTENFKDPIFANTCSSSSIGSIQSVRRSSLNFKIEIFQQNFCEIIISCPFLAVKTTT